MKVAARLAKVRVATHREERPMALRDKLVELADEFWTKGVEAADRKSWIEANTYKHAANRIRETLGMEPLS